MTNQHNKEMRKAFEKWALDNCCDVSVSEIFGTYQMPATQRSFAGWQAATAAADAKYLPVIENLVEKMRLVIDDLHYSTVPYEQYAPQMGDTLWNMLAGDKQLLIEAVALAAPLLEEKKP